MQMTIENMPLMNFRVALRKSETGLDLIHRSGEPGKNTSANFKEFVDFILSVRQLIIVYFFEVYGIQGEMDKNQKIEFLEFDTHPPDIAMTGSKHKKISRFSLYILWENFQN